MTNSTTEKIDREKLVRVADGVLIVEVSMIADALAQDNTAFNQFRERISASLPQAKAIVLNCRGKAEAGECAAFYFDLFTRRALAQILDSNVTLGSARRCLEADFHLKNGSKCWVRK